MESNHLLSIKDLSYQHHTLKTIKKVKLELGCVGTRVQAFQLILYLDKIQVGFIFKLNLLNNLKLVSGENTNRKCLDTFPFPMTNEPQKL